MIKNKLAFARGWSHVTLTTASLISGTIAKTLGSKTGGKSFCKFDHLSISYHVRLCPYADICCWDGCANRCLNFTPPDSVFFREGYGILVD